MGSGDSVGRAGRLSADIRETSDLISGSYRPGLDPEAHMWRRVGKVSEEAGEVTEALLGYLGENPRKGRTNGLDKVRDELLDTANAALGAVAHLYPGCDPVKLLAAHSRSRLIRLRAAIGGA